MQTHARRGPCKGGGRGQGAPSTSQECQRSPAYHQRPLGRLSSQPQMEAAVLSPHLSLLASRAVTKTLCCLSYSVSPWCFVAKAANTDVCKVLGSILGPTASIIVGKTPALSLEASLALCHTSGWPADPRAAAQSAWHLATLIPSSPWSPAWVTESAPQQPASCFHLCPPQSPSATEISRWCWNVSHSKPRAPHLTHGTTTIFPSITFPPTTLQSCSLPGRGQAHAEALALSVPFTWMLFPAFSWPLPPGLPGFAHREKPSQQAHPVALGRRTAVEQTSRSPVPSFPTTDAALRWDALWPAQWGGCDSLVSYLFGQVPEWGPRDTPEPAPQPRQGHCSRHDRR